MRKRVMILIAAACILALTVQSFAEDQTHSRIAQFPLEFSLFNHAVSLPFDGIILNPIHPGFSLGTEFGYSEGKLGRIFQALHAGYYYNKFNAKALLFQTEAGYRYTFGFGLYGDLTVGVGYTHCFHVGDVFKLNSQGEYEQAKDKGKGGLIILVSV